MKVCLKLSFAMLVVPLLFAATAYAQAPQKYPVKPIRLIVAFTAGGTTDILARLLTPGMHEAWGQPVVIEPRPGAGGTLAASIVSKAAADGYTLLATSPAFAISAVMNSGLQYDTLKDFVGVGEIGYSTTVLVAAPSLGVKTVKDWIALAHTRQGKLLFGSTGAFTSTHFSAERAKAAAGIRAQHVGFKGQSEFLIEIMADRIQFGCPGLTVALPLIRDGKLIPLAVAIPQRTPALPDVPAAPEVLPGWGRDGSQAWYAPAGTPRFIRERISKELTRNLALPEVKERLNNLGFHIAPTTPADHDKNLRTDIEVFTRIAKDAGLKPK